MSFRQSLRRHYFRRLAETPRGRAHILLIAAEAEEADEGEIFEQLRTRVSDAKLQKLAERHGADEERHAALFRKRLEDVGFADLPALPGSLKLIRRINAEVGLFERGIRTDEDVMLAYAMLLVIEERGTEQFPELAQALRPHDEESANLFERVAADEARHVKYCEAIGPRYAPDRATWERTVATCRAVESRALDAIGAADMAYTLSHGVVRAPRVARWAARAFAPAA